MQQNEILGIVILCSLITLPMIISFVESQTHSEPIYFKVIKKVLSYVYIILSTGIFISSFLEGKSYVVRIITIFLFIISIINFVLIARLENKYVLALQKAAFTSVPLLTIFTTEFHYENLQTSLDEGMIKEYKKNLSDKKFIPCIKHTDCCILLKNDFLSAKRLTFIKNQINAKEIYQNFLKNTKGEDFENKIIFYLNGITIKMPSEDFPDEYLKYYKF